MVGLHQHGVCTWIDPFYLENYREVKLKMQSSHMVGIFTHTILWPPESKIASRITSLTIVYSTIYSGPDQTKHQSSASLAFVRGIHRAPVNFPHKWPVTRKMFPFDDFIMLCFATVILRRHMQELKIVKSSQNQLSIKWRKLSNHTI